MLPEGAVADRPKLEVRTQLRTVEAPKSAADLAQADIDALLNG
jgi:hypothetical protein